MVKNVNVDINDLYLLTLLKHERFYIHRFRFTYSAVDDSRELNCLFTRGSRLKRGGCQWY